MKIILACAAGMSTSMLVERMKKSAEERGIDLVIDAVAVTSLAAHLDGVQIILLGPQVSYLLNQISEEYAPIPVKVIEMMDYGMMNGTKVLDDAMKDIGA